MNKEQPKYQDIPDPSLAGLEDKSDILLAQRRTKRKAVINHVFIKGT